MFSACVSNIHGPSRTFTVKNMQLYSVLQQPSRNLHGSFTPDMQNCSTRCLVAPSGSRRASRAQAGSTLPLGCRRLSAPGGRGQLLASDVHLGRRRLVVLRLRDCVGLSAVRRIGLPTRWAVVSPTVRMCCLVVFGGPHGLCRLVVLRCGAAARRDAPPWPRGGGVLSRRPATPRQPRLRQRHRGRPPGRRFTPAAGICSQFLNCCFVPRQDSRWGIEVLALQEVPDNAQEVGLGSDTKLLGERSNNPAAQPHHIETRSQGARGHKRQSIPTKF